MVLERLFKTPVGIVLLSIIWGLGISTLFAHARNYQKTYIIYGPPINTLTAKKFNYGTDKCYQYEPVHAKCGGAPPPP